VEARWAGTLRAVAKTSKAGSWVTTADVARAAGVSEVTIRRWAQRGVLPKYEVHHGGRRGHAAMWPPHAPQQAAWVLEQLEARRSWEDIVAALDSGEFKIPPQ
jgi:hypothetical protein